MNSGLKCDKSMNYLIKGSDQRVLGVGISLKSYKFASMRLISVCAISAMVLLLASCETKETDTISDANPDLDSLLLAHPDSIPLLLKRGNLYVEEFNFDLALADVARAFRLDTNNIESKILYAEVISRKNSRTPGEVASAQRLYISIIKEQPKNLKALVGLAGTYSYQHDFKSSFKFINIALRVDKHYRDAYVLKGTNYMVIGDRDKAVSSYETAIQQDPEFYVAYILLGQIYQNEGNAQSLEYYRSAAKLKPELSSDLRYYLAYSEQKYGDIEEAKRLYREMASDTNDLSISLGLFHQGWIKHFDDHDIDSAIYFYESAVVNTPGHIESWHNLGMCYDAKGNKTQALKSFSKALQIDGDYEISRNYADSIRLL